MSLHNVTPGPNAPNEFNVIIEIPMNADPIKYEVDEESGALFVDRFMATAMHYPCNYGYIPQTLADDGDPVDVLVMTPVPLIPGVVVTCRPLGVLRMQDEAGGDNKLLAVPMNRSTNKAPDSSSTSYLIGSAFIGISMITLNSPGALAPGVTLCRLMVQTREAGQRTILGRGLASA